MAKTALEQWDETNANNTDVGSINISEGCPPSGINNAIREEMAQVAAWLGDDTLASATTTNLGSVAGRYVEITGTTTITGFGTIKAGTIKYLKFSGALTLTRNATSLILPGAANITTAAGDTAIFVSEGSGNWRCVNYTPASPRPNTVNGQYRFPSNPNLSTESNVLDDYEEFIFTPAITIGGAAVGLTYNGPARGRYTKIGNRVLFWARVVLLSKGSSTGEVLITGLPFEAVSDAGVQQPVSYACDNVTACVAARVFTGTNTVALYRQNGTNLVSFTNADLTNSADISIAGQYETSA